MLVLSQQQEVVPMNLHYQKIGFKGHLDPSWSIWFDGLPITHEANGERVLTGPLLDQAALYGILEKARNLNLTLVAVSETPSGPLTHHATH
jgi:hypothetical protein